MGLRIGLIGLGRIGAFHAATLGASEEVEELLVTDPVPTAVDAVTSTVGKARAFATPDDLIAAAPDGLVIAAATAAHPELLLAGVTAGIPTFCEKPIAADPADAVRLQQRVSVSEVPVQIGYPRRFDPAFVAAREAVRSGELGRVHTVRSTTLDPAPPPAAYLAGSGGIFRDCAVHDFDAVRWVTGQEVVAVTAVGVIDPDAAPELYADNGDWTTVSALLTMSDGTIGVVSNTRANAAGYDVRLEVHGTRDAVAAGWDEGAPVRATQPGVTWPNGPAHGFFMDRLTEAFRRELATFCAVVDGRAESPCTIDDAMGTAWTAEAATLSAREGRTVTLDEVRR